MHEPGYGACPVHRRSGAVVQLALADSLDWFDSSRLNGFVDEAIEILLQSEWATAEGRLESIRRGLERRVIEVNAAVEVLRHVRR